MEIFCQTAIPGVYQFFFLLENFKYVCKYDSFLLNRDLSLNSVNLCSRVTTSLQKSKPEKLFERDGRKPSG